MIVLSFKAAKEGFFDIDKVQRALNAAARKALTRFGTIVRRAARASMKSGRKGKSVSKPGEPPRVQKGQLKRFLFFSWDSQSRSVVIGPSRLPSGGGIVPGILEAGGQSVMRNPRRRLRKVLTGGEIAIDRPGGTTTKPNAGGRLVTYILLRTAAQVARANKLQEVLYGPDKVTVHIAARPYMGPALRSKASELPPLWAGSVHA